MWHHPGQGQLARVHPGLDVAGIQATDAHLPELAGDVQAAVASALPAVLELTRSLGRSGKRFHVHRHDGQPLIPGLSDHFGFLWLLVLTENAELVTSALRQPRGGPRTVVP